MLYGPGSLADQLGFAHVDAHDLVATPPKGAVIR